MHQDHEIVEWLVKEKRITRKQAAGLRGSAGDDVSLELFMVQNGLLDKATLLKIKSDINLLPAVDLDPDRIDPKIVQLIPQALSRKFAAVPVAIQNNHLIVALANPSDPFARYYLQMRANLEVEARVAYLGDVLAVQQRAYPADEPEVMGPRLYPDLSDAANDRVRRQEARRITLSGEPTMPPSGVRDEDRPGVHRSGPGDVDRPSPPVQPTDGSRRDEARPLSLSDVYTLTECARDIARSHNLDDAVARILQAARKLTDADSTAFLLCQKDRRYISYVAALGAHEDVSQFAIPFDETTLPGWCVLRNESISVEALRSDDRFLTQAEVAAGLPLGGTSCIPVIWHQEVLGALVAANHARHVPDPAPLEILAAPLGASVRAWQMQSSIHNISMEAVETLLDMADLASPGTKRHAGEVAGLATTMARFLSLSTSEIEHLCFAALLHDLGLTNRKDRDDPEHPQAAALILQKLNMLQPIIPIIRYHHERFDGTGYPWGLKGETVPLLARVLAVAEAYYELGLHRSDRDARALQNFLESFGQAFDPALKAAFIRAVNVPEE